MQMLEWMIASNPRPNFKNGNNVNEYRKTLSLSPTSKRKTKRNQNESTNIAKNFLVKNDLVDNKKISKQSNRNFNNRRQKNLMKYKNRSNNNNNNNNINVNEDDKKEKTCSFDKNIVKKNPIFNETVCKNDTVELKKYSLFSLESFGKINKISTRIKPLIRNTIYLPSATTKKSTIKSILEYNQVNDLVNLTNKHVNSDENNKVNLIDIKSSKIFFKDNKNIAERYNEISLIESKNNINNNNIKNIKHKKNQHKQSKINIVSSYNIFKSNLNSDAVNETVMEGKYKLLNRTRSINYKRHNFPVIKMDSKVNFKKSKYPINKKNNQFQKYRSLHKLNRTIGKLKFFKKNKNKDFGNKNVMNNKLNRSKYSLINQKNNSFLISKKNHKGHALKNIKTNFAKTINKRNNLKYFINTFKYEIKDKCKKKYKTLISKKRRKNFNKLKSSKSNFNPKMNRINKSKLSANSVSKSSDSQINFNISKNNSKNYYMIIPKSKEKFCNKHDNHYHPNKSNRSIMENHLIRQKRIRRCGSKLDKNYNSTNSKIYFSLMLSQRRYMIYKKKNLSNLISIKKNEDYSDNKQKSETIIPLSYTTTEKVKNYQDGKVENRQICSFKQKKDLTKTKTENTLSNLNDTSKVSSNEMDSLVCNINEKNNSRDRTYLINDSQLCEYYNHSKLMSRNLENEKLDSRKIYSNFNETSKYVKNGCSCRFLDNNDELNRIVHHHYHYYHHHHYYHHYNGFDIGFNDILPPALFNSNLSNDNIQLTDEKMSFENSMNHLFFDSEQKTTNLISNNTLVKLDDITLGSSFRYREEIKDTDENLSPIINLSLGRSNNNNLNSNNNDFTIVTSLVQRTIKNNIKKSTGTSSFTTFFHHIDSPVIIENKNSVLEERDEEEEINNNINEINKRENDNQIQFNSNNLIAKRLDEKYNYYSSSNNFNSEENGKISSTIDYTTTPDMKISNHNYNNNINYIKYRNQSITDSDSNQNKWKNNLKINEYDSDMLKSNSLLNYFNNFSNFNNFYQDNKSNCNFSSNLVSSEKRNNNSNNNSSENRVDKTKFDDETLMGNFNLFHI